MLQLTDCDRTRDSIGACAKWHCIDGLQSIFISIREAEEERRQDLV